MDAIKILTALTLVFYAHPASALTYFLSQDLGVRGQFHLCQYSNGKVYSFNATDLCPMQVNDDGPANFGGGGSIKQQGFKSGEYQDGMTKVCVYNVMGRSEALRISSVGICPLNYEF